jgi:DNA-binding SARP family transcriptional activator
VAIEFRAGADLGLGRYGELAGELDALCREHALRERLWELLILALYRSGRQAEALRLTRSTLLSDTAMSAGTKGNVRGQLAAS